MSHNPADNPIIAQSHQEILVEVSSPRYEAVRGELARFAELVRSPEHIHTYRITPLSIWNACAAGLNAEAMLGILDEYAKFPLPTALVRDIKDYAARYGRLQLLNEEGAAGVLRLSASDNRLADEIANSRQAQPFLGMRRDERCFEVAPAARGPLKAALIHLGHPVQDRVGGHAGDPLSFALRQETAGGRRLALRDYQEEAVQAFLDGDGAGGVIVLPCGAGKTIVGLAGMARLQTSTLILTTSVTASRQWIDELLDKTTLTAEQIAEFDGAAHETRPVTVATYHALAETPDLMAQRPWGLVIYDEVHLVPDSVLQLTAKHQELRRLGLTATLVREDEREDDVFALIGPKRMDRSWKTLEAQGWIAKATCVEVRLALPEALRVQYAMADSRAKFSTAAKNPDKTARVRQILARHPEEAVLVMGLYVEQMEELARELDIPLLAGTSAQKKRDKVFGEFKEGKIRVLAVSKIANFAIDLPDAAVAIQVSGTFGSRQEEAQRLGRILRPKPGKNQAHFYSLVTRDTVEQDFANQRQRFLCEQGYAYQIEDAEAWAGVGDQQK